MRYLNILFIVLTLNSFAGFEMRFTTDYNPEFGKVYMWIKDQSHASVVEDHNSCGMDNYGLPRYCTRMGFPSKEVTMNLIDHNNSSKLLELAPLKHLRLSITNDKIYLLFLDENSQRTIRRVQLRPEYSFN
jgi:hypothetical protein